MGLDDGIAVGPSKKGAAYRPDQCSALIDTDSGWDLRCCWALGWRSTALDVCPSFPILWGHLGFCGPAIGPLPSGVGALRSMGLGPGGLSLNFCGPATRHPSHHTLDLLHTLLPGPMPATAPQHYVQWEAPITGRPRGHRHLYGNHCIAKQRAANQDQSRPL